jgi:FPC/CPF motif-containing protein YcgG
LVDVHIAEAGDWVAPAYTAFTRTVLTVEPDYPCYFGARGQLDGNNSFAALDERAGAAVADLARSLVAFRRRARSGPKRQSLIVFVGPPRRPVDLNTDVARFWDLLTALHEHNPMPWPVDVPADPRDPRWQWCFAGEPWFTFLCSPAYQARRSRNVGPCLTMVFQTRRVFDGLSGTSVAGRAAKAMVRQRLLSYDAVPPHPHLGDGASSTRHKWRQYALPDDQAELALEACPWPAVSSGSIRPTGGR